MKLIISILMILILPSAIYASIHLAPRENTAAMDISYVVGTTGHELIWQFEAQEANDEPSHYSITVNGDPLSGHTLTSWQDNVDIVINVDGYSVGVYTFEITVNDTGTDQGLAPAATDSAVVTVTDQGNSTDTSSMNSVSSSSSSTIPPTTSSNSNADSASIYFIMFVLTFSILIRKKKNNAI